VEANMGYKILFVFTGFVIAVFSAFLAGYSKGAKKGRQEQAETALQKAESDNAFHAEKEKIMEEVFNNAESKKAELSSGSGRERFDAINNGLRGEKRD
jgi:hypothetical protein